MAFKDTAVYFCAYCGEKITSKAIYCKNCATKDGRKKIFEANAAVWKDAREKGYNPPSGMPDWRPRVNAQGALVKTTAK